MYVVGLVGPFGSGCSYVAEKIVENHGYEYLSLSAVLREEYKKEKPNKRKIERKELQDFGDKIRETKGAENLFNRGKRSICSNIY